MNDLGRYFAFWPMPRGRANRCIDAGDAARDAGAWDQAAFHYRRAVTIQPRRRPIWVQLGHAEKEAGRPQAALDAYARASLLPGEDNEPALHHGLQAKAMGLYALAKVSFEKAFREDPASPGARGEWQVMLHHPLAASEADKATAAKLLKVDQNRLEALPPSQSQLIFDVTDLLNHFRNARLPTGVQRVQIEVIRATIPFHPGLRICCFTGADQGWVKIPVEQFQAICTQALADGDMFEPVWVRSIEVLAATVALAAPVGFAPGDVLINLGTSWILPNYFLHVRHAKRTKGICYIPFVHDVIPVMAPQYCLPDVVQDYLGWVGGVFDHADHLLANSCSTARDLKHVAAQLGRRLDESDVTVVPLNAAIPGAGTSTLPVSSLDRWGLASGDYVLFVSSIEPRKNHLMALRAWQAMLARDSAATPDLICVGHGGWLNGPVHTLLREDPMLAAKVRILSEISDTELALLYSQCRFSIYPSHYEGWGMPVTEALCHGKVPIVTRCSSLTEAGGDFAVYVEPDDVCGLSRAVEELWQKPERLTALEARITQDFRPRAWSDIALQVSDASTHCKHIVRQDVPWLKPDTIYRLRKNCAMHLVPGEQIGEMLRQGLGWQPLEPEHARTDQNGGVLSFRSEGNRTHIACHLRLAPSAAGQTVSVTTADEVHHMTTTGWLSFRVPVVDDHVDLQISGGAALSYLLISDDIELAGVAERIGAQASSEYGFLRDIYPLITGRDVGAAEMAEFLPPLESGGLTRADILGVLTRKAGKSGL